MKTAGSPQKIIAGIVRRNRKAIEEHNPQDIATIDHIFLDWLWEDFLTLVEENRTLHAEVRDLRRDNGINCEIIAGQRAEIGRIRDCLMGQRDINDSRR